METKDTSEIRYTSPAFAICGACDAEYPAGTAECAKCKSPLSAVRKCPECGRILSAKHERCLYCKASFVQAEGTILSDAPRPISVANAAGTDKRRRAILVSIGVFLLVMFFGLYATIAKLKKNGPEVAATTYILSGARLKLQPNENAGSSMTLTPATVVSLTGMAVDPEGHRWYVLRESGSDAFLAVTDVAPPKVRLPELGSQMLRAWLVAFRDPSLIPEADSAVAYFCANFASSPHCDELRWIAAERFRSIADQGNFPDARGRARQLYQAVADGRGAHSDDALNAVKKLQEAKPSRGIASQKHRPSTSDNRSETYSSDQQYALVDRAEVRVRVPELKTLMAGSQVRAPIANEIRINGKVAVPSNAICILKLLQSRNNELALQLTAIEFGNKQYPVATEPKPVPPKGGTVVFPLESSLLIGK